MPSRSERLKAYASGCDIVILGSDFECVQIIPGAKHGNIQVGCVECSLQQGRIAASYGNTVCIFEPVPLRHCKRKLVLNYQWQKKGQFFLQSVAYNLAWDPQGNQLLTATDHLQLWSPPSHDILEEESSQDDEYKVQPDLNDWKCNWQCMTAIPIYLMKWSPDGEFFATAGKDDSLLKVWYQTTSWKSAVVGGEIAGEKVADFSFIYLAHPRAVTGFSWRKTSKYMPRSSVCNVLLTSCQDGVCRLWAETLLPEDCLFGGQMAETTVSTSTSNISHGGSQKDKIQHALETIHHLKHLSGRRRSSVLNAHIEALPSQLGSHEVHRQISHYANALCHFHIAASINPNTDIPPALAGTAFNIEESGGNFVVHWLNNKELHFTSSMEMFMEHLRKLTDHEMEDEVDIASQNGLKMKLDTETEETSEKGSEYENEEGEEEGRIKIPSLSYAGVSLPTILLDRNIEALQTEWNKNADMLFTIHPIDGSFLVWHVKYLDEYHPGIFRQVQVAFSSRIPVAFPTGDANSLSRNIMMYAYTLKNLKHLPNNDPKINGITHHVNGSKINIASPSVMMISKHIDGSLNQWAVTFAEESAFSTVLIVSHKFRYCGHRFHLNDLACHSVLPLLLTSSHHNALMTPEMDVITEKFKVEPVKFLKGERTQQVKNAATRTFHDPNAIYSELILWRMDPIGPLSYSGGVSELARINSLHTSAFSNVAWLPTLIPSYCLGTYCNSASACFVASDGQNLRLYQAVVDARKLLDELSDPEISKLVGEVFNIVSQQSTARPGCIIELDVITKQCGSNTQLLHVFQEDFILGYKPQEEKIVEQELPCIQSAQGYHAPSFSEKFYLVVIERDKKRSVLHMWHLHLKSVQPHMEVFTSNKLRAVFEEKNFGSSPNSLPRSASVANLQTASKLILNSKLVYSQQLNLPEEVEVIRATPSAGHLSSSSIYPVCLAPYLIVTSCSDGKVRFWRCTVDKNSNSENSEEVRAYWWETWPLMNEEGEHKNSAVMVTGRPVAVSCSYTGRLAVAYKESLQPNGMTSKEFSMHVSIFECESTGGSEWVLEQTIHLDDLGKVGGVLDSRVSVDSNLFVYNKSDLYLKGKNMMSSIKHLVHLDWVSKEDGSHILTVGVGSKILMYGRLSGIVTEQATSKDGLAVITLPLGGSIKQGTKSKWVLLRCVDLISSVDGTPSLPVSLSWVRDGILVIGMDCEMHVYAQWKHSTKPLNDTENGSLSSFDEFADIDTFETKMLPKWHSIADGTTVADDVFGVPGMIQDGGLFEAAHILSPTLPQYHPTQLLELMDLGKVRRAKAILSHLVKCIAGEVTIFRDKDPGEGGGPRRHLSRTISVSGSTGKDTIIAGREGTRDYTEIDSIPPLPLYALLSADQDTSYKIAEETTKIDKGSQIRSKKMEDQYADLFQSPGLTTDDFVDFVIEKKESKSKVINLSQYGPTYFGPEHARVLSSHLMHSSLPGLTRLEQMFLVALADTVATTSTEVNENRDKDYSGETLDECGLRYLLAMRLHICLLTSLPPVYRLQLLHQGLSTCHFAWAFHSEAEEELLSMIPAMQKGDPQWSDLKAMGVGWWIRNINTLRKCIEKVAKAAFQRNNDALDAALFYLALKKKAVLWGLFRSQQDKKMTEFFKHNFSEDRWRKAALKNAFALLGKQRFEQAAAFFLLAGSLKDAIEVILEKMDDIQLAMIIARLYESDYETSSTCKSILYEKVLGYKPGGSEFSLSKLHPDPFLRSIAYWTLKNYSNALDTLLEQPTKGTEEHPEPEISIKELHKKLKEYGEVSGYKINANKSEAMPMSNADFTKFKEESPFGWQTQAIRYLGILIKSCNPVVFSFYNYLRTHPLLMRRHFASPEGSLATLGHGTEKISEDEINLIERKLFFTTANAHFKVGCPVLALEVLSKIPKVMKKSKPSLTSEDSKLSVQRQNDVAENNRSTKDANWSQTVTGSSGMDGETSNSAGFDWGVPLVTFSDEPLKLEWDNDLEDDYEEEGGLTMKDAETVTVANDEKDMTRESQTVPNEDSFSTDSRVDVIAEQLKFRACLKILMTELRTLATGYEVDGGKLRFQLYNWLEKEIHALHQICNYKTEVKDLDVEIDKVSNPSFDQEELTEGTEGASYERHQIDRRRLQAKQEHAEKRKWWLRRNQALLRVFLSYCSLHGAQGGGLASVRMELIFLLQESQQETTVKQLQSPLPLPTTLPLLSATVASTKTVIANPIMHLSNHIHDILYTVVQMNCPPLPGLKDEKVFVLHTSAASLSACIYQSLCDSHSYSQTATNLFTGMVYQGLLLGERRRLRTESVEEHVAPNSSASHWPGVSSLINLLGSVQEDDQPRLNVLLCEAVIGVYLSLLIHGLATQDGNELFRLVAHPLNNRTWAAVFGGGAKTIIKPKKRPEITPGIPNVSAALNVEQNLALKTETIDVSMSLSCETGTQHTPGQDVPPEAIDRYRRRFNMKMLVPGRPVKETSAPPPVPAERPSYKEKFIPPELSMWDYFVSKPFLPPSESGFMYDSDESISSDDGNEDGTFISDVQLQEHSDPNSYSWALIRLGMVKLALNNVKYFFPVAGLDSADLPVTSPLGNAVVKTLENWQQILQAKMEQFEGPPPNYINTYPNDFSNVGGPAILRHKAMLEPENTPFKSRHYSTFPVKRLWYYLVKQEILQDTFIRFIFTKKRKQSESVEDHVDQVKQNYVREHRGSNKVEADLGYPGGRSKIIHKDSDAIMAFAINKANSNEIVLASTHDVQELDLSAILAAQPFTWIGEDSDRDSRSSDDVEHRPAGSTSQASPTHFGSSQLSSSSSMPWLGSGQTSAGATVIIKRNLNNVKRMTSHPAHRYYLTGAQDGSVRMFEWNRPQQVICFRQAGNARVTRLYFNTQGNKLGVADGEGFLSLWQVNQTGSNPKPYLSWQCHSKAAGDFAFITSSSLITTAGQSNDNRNVCLWDTLISPHNSLVHGFVCHENGATVLQYASKQQLLISGGRKGFVCIFDIRQRQLLHTFQAHDSAIKALALDSTEDYFITGSAEGNMKVWRLTSHGLIHSFTNEHAKQSIFRNIGAGIVQLEIRPTNRIFSCGADGTLKTRVLPDCFNIPTGMFDIL
ncbi:dmX-like protein 2 [Narcine bancroftii]|uniref:dmX-like protein 2 n=1 Tax=Narcine bancroftii TaxID=1343680 RepID=UPI00383233A1